MQLDVPYDAVNDISVAILQGDLELLREDLAKSKNGIHVRKFSTDRREDRRRIKRLIRAYVRVLEYHGVKE